jgi:hypothetical protein
MPRSAPPTTDPGPQGIQPRGAVPVKWLSKFEGTEAAEHLARLDADAALLTTLELAGFEGRDWNRFAEALAEYGYQVIRAWVGTGTIYARCRQRGFGGADIVQPPWGAGAAEVDSLSNETVALAVRGFREKVLMKGRWDRNRGATLKTFFIGQCLMRFPTAFRRWREQCRPLPSESDDVLRLQPAGDRWDPAYTGIMNDELRRALRDAAKDDTKRAMLLLDGQGFSDSEIAEVLGTTTDAVDSFLYRHRRARKGTA